MDSQKQLLRELDVAEGESWVILLDCARPDYFSQIYDQYLSGTYQTVWNHDCKFTPQWFEEMFSYLVDGYLFNGGTPIHRISQSYDWDGSDYFDHVPSATQYPVVEEESWVTPDPSGIVETVKRTLPTNSQISERLRDLGYMGKSKPGPEIHDEISFNMNVVRFVKPHQPYRSLPSMRRGDIVSQFPDRFSHAEWKRAYLDNLEWGLENVSELIDILQSRDANIVVTADHGDCLGNCGCYFHGPSNDAHDHLVTVPWLRVD